MEGQMSLFSQSRPALTAEPARPRALVRAAAALVIAIVLPLAAVGVYGIEALVTPGVLVNLLESVLPEYALNTLGLSVIAGAVALAIGLPGAWFLAAYEFRARRWMEWSLVLPLALPAYVMAYAYTDALDPSGWLYQWIAAQGALFSLPALPRFEIRSLVGAAFILGVALSPYVSLLARVAFEERQGTAFDAARTMGLSGRQVFFRLALPAARPAWIAGLALVIMECFADYGTVAFFALPTLSTGLFKAWFAYGDRPTAALIALVMMIVAVGLLLLESRTRGRAQWSAVRAGGRAQRLPAQANKAWAMSLWCALPGVFGFFVPIAFLVIAALDAQTIPDWSRLIDQAMASVMLGILAVAVVLCAAWVCGYALRSGDDRSQSVIRMASGGYAVPGLVIAVGLLAWSSLFTQAMDYVFGWQVALVGTGVLMIGAYLTRFFSVGLGPIESGLGRITRNLEWSAASLGLDRYRIFSRVHLPLMKRATAVAALLVFVDVIKELPATLVLRPFNLETLAVSAHHLAADERLGAAAWPALMIGLVGLIPMLMLGPTMRR